MYGIALNYTYRIYRIYVRATFFHKKNISSNFRGVASPGDAGDDGVDSPLPLRRRSISFTTETETIFTVEVTVQVNSVTAINIKRILFDVDFTLMRLGVWIDEIFWCFWGWDGFCYTYIYIFLKPMHNFVWKLIHFQTGFTPTTRYGMLQRYNFYFLFLVSCGCEVFFLGDVVPERAEFHWVVNLRNLL